MADHHNHRNRQSVRVPEYDYSQSGAYFVTLVTHERACLFGEIIAGRMQLSPPGRIVEEQWLRLPRRFPNWATDAFQIMPNHLHGVLNKKIATQVGAQRSFPCAGSETATLRPASNIKGLSLPDMESLDIPGACDGLAQGAASSHRPCASEGSLPVLERSERGRPYRNYRNESAKQPNRRVEADSLGAVVRAYKSAVTFRIKQLLDSPGQPLWQRNYYEHIIRDEDDLDRIRLYIRENPLRWTKEEDNMEGNLAY